MNENKIILTKQRKLLLIIVSVILVVIGGLWAVNKKANEKETTKQKLAHDIPPPEPDLTGSVTNTFDSSVEGNVIVANQLNQRNAQNALKDVQAELKSLTNKLTDMEKKNADLNDQLVGMQEQVGTLKAAQNTYPAPATEAPHSEYHLGPAPVAEGQIDSPVFDYSSIDRAKKAPDTSFYIPSGTFSNAIVIEGADANASVRGEQSLVPMQFKLTGLAHLPGNTRLGKLANCFVTAAAFGDISSERANVQVQRLSCVIGKKHIDQKVKGHVSFYGKNGIKGIPVMRNGKILGLAFSAGALGGFGQSISQVGQTVAGVGATATISGSEVARNVIGNGASTAANKLADYYIDRAEQYHPIIPIGAANRVEVVFIEGFKAEFLEDKEAAKLQKKFKQSTSEDSTTADHGNTGLPPEMVGKLGDASHLAVSDFVTPSPQEKPRG